MPYKPYQGSIIGLISPCKALFLGLSWAIWAILNHFGVILGPFLGHLEGIFEVSVFKKAPSPKMPQPISVGATFFGGWVILPLFRVMLRVIFYPTFSSFRIPLLVTILGSILGPDRPKRGQGEPKRAIRISKSQKAAFSKSLKNPYFF